MGDKFGIVANVISDRVFRSGAKVWLSWHNGDAVCVKAIGLAKSGRVVEKYTHHKRTTTRRAKWIPEHLRERVRWQWDTKAEAQAFADSLNSMWAGVRFFDRNGRLLQDGVPESEAFKRASSDPG